MNRKNEIEYWERVLNSFNEVYNDNAIVDGINSFSKKF
jgi:hypothetical protein